MTVVKPLPKTRSGKILLKPWS